MRNASAISRPAKTIDRVPLATAPDRAKPNWHSVITMEGANLLDHGSANSIRLQLDLMRKFAIAEYIEFGAGHC